MPQTASAMAFLRSMVPNMPAANAQSWKALADAKVAAPTSMPIISDFCVCMHLDLVVWVTELAQYQIQMPAGNLQISWDAAP